MTIVVTVLATICAILLFFVWWNWDCTVQSQHLKNELHKAQVAAELSCKQYRELAEGVHKDMDERWVKAIPEWVQGLRFKKLIPINSPSAPPSTNTVAYDGEWLSWEELEKKRNTSDSYTFHSEPVKVGGKEWVVKVGHVSYRDEKWWMVESVLCVNVPF